MTGVQTCALPIFRLKQDLRAPFDGAQDERFWGMYIFFGPLVVSPSNHRFTTNLVSRKHLPPP